MSERRQRVRDLLRDPSLGAGNFAHKLVSAGLDQPDQLSLDVGLELGACDAERLGLGQLVALSDRVAAWYAGSGVAPKDPVALWFADTAHYLLHYLALTSIGALPVQINGGLEPRIALAFLTGVGATRIMTDASREAALRSELAANGSRIPYYDIDSAPWLTAAAPAAPARFRHQPDDPVLIGHSSGTTGLPKAVRFNHEGFFYGVRRELHKQPGERVLSALPHSHASALSILMSACLRGAAIRLQTHKEPLQLLAAIGSFRPDLFVSFPKVYVDLCRLDLEQHDLSSIAYWLSTGDANHESHIRRLMQFGSHPRKDGTRAPGSLFIDNLGASELGFAAFRNVHRPGDDDSRYARRIGRAFDWVDAAVLDEQGNRAEPFQVGRLAVRAPSVTPGYWNDSLLTEKSRVSGYWLTGDLAYRDEDDVFFHVDRVSDAVITQHGVLYSCQAEELVLKHFPEVFDCSIAAARGPDRVLRPD